MGLAGLHQTPAQAWLGQGTLELARLNHASCASSPVFWLESSTGGSVDCASALALSIEPINSTMPVCPPAPRSRQPHRNATPSKSSDARRGAGKQSAHPAEEKKCDEGPQPGAAYVVACAGAAEVNPQTSTEEEN